MTSQCKSILAGLKKLANNTESNISYRFDDPSFCLDEGDLYFSYEGYENEIESIIQSLVDDGYLKYNYGNQFNFSLTQKGIHKTQFTLFSIAAYFSDKLIDILALVIATLALSKSYGYDLLTPAITFFKTILEQLLK